MLMKAVSMGVELESVWKIVVLLIKTGEPYFFEKIQGAYKCASIEFELIYDAAEQPFKKQLIFFGVVSIIKAPRETCDMVAKHHIEPSF